MTNIYTGLTNFKFRNELFRKYNYPIFYNYIKDNKKIIYTFFYNKKIVNYSKVDIDNLKTLVAIPINFTTKLYEIDYENNFILLRSKDFYRWLYIYNKWVIIYNKYPKLYYDIGTYLSYLNYNKLYFLYI